MKQISEYVGRPKGGESYYHQMMCAVMVHPSQSVVLPIALEPILKQDGESKNDCERNLSKRLLEKLRRMHPKLKMVIIEDGFDLAIQLVTFALKLRIYCASVI